MSLMETPGVIKAIQENLIIGAVLGTARYSKAQLFVNHALILMAQNIGIVEQWLAESKGNRISLVKEP